MVCVYIITSQLVIMTRVVGTQACDTGFNAIIKVKMSLHLHLHRRLCNALVSLLISFDAQYCDKNQNLTMLAFFLLTFYIMYTLK